MIDVFILMVVGVIGVFIVTNVRVISARHFAISEQWGHFKKVLLPGVHILYPIISSLHQFRWSFQGQDGRLKHVMDSVMSFDENPMDIQPIVCRTRDSFLVTVDGIAYYKITDLPKAAYESSDPLNLLYQCLNQSVRNVIAKATARDLNGADAALSGSIVDGTNQLFSNEKYGLLCTKFLVQSVRLDDQMLKNEQAIAAAHRQQQLKLEQMESEHQNALRTLEMQAEKQKKESENALMAERGRQAILDEQCSAERRRKNSEYKELYTDQGFTVDHYLQLQYIKAQESLQSRAERVIYAPNDFFRGPTIK